MALFEHIEHHDCSHEKNGARFLLTKNWGKLMRLQLFSTAAIVLVSASSAYAQSSAPASPAPSTATPQASETFSLEEVIVTAQRRSENIQQVALPITAIGGEALAQRGVNNVQGLSSLVPTLTVGTYGSYTQVFLRGIGDFGGTPLSESPIAANLDQVYQASPALTGGYFYDIDSIELLKGPQGTLYGRNASGGALNIITKKPNLDGFEGYVKAGYGNYQAHQIEAALNVPLGDNFALRAAGQILGHDGYYNDGYDDDKRKGVRVGALYRPRDTFSVLVTADYEHQGGRGAGFSLTPRPVPSDPWIGPSDPRNNAVIASTPGIGPFLRPVGDDGFNRVSTWGVTANVDWDLGPVTLTVIPAYRRYKVDLLTYTAGGYDRVSSPEHQFSLETRLGSANSGPLKYTIGAFYYDQSGSGFYGIDFGPFVEQFEILIHKTTDKSAAAFFETTYSLTPTLRLTGGLRYTYEKKTLASDLVGSPSFSTTTFSFLPCSAAQTTVPVPQGTGFLPGASYYCSSPANGALKVNRETWKLGIEYDVAPQSLLFFTVATGFKAGGFSQGAAPNTFFPEKLLAYELGSKNRFLDNRLQVNVEAFLWKYSDQQVSQTGIINPPPVLGYLVRNAGQATLSGVNLDVQYHATSNDTLRLAAEYLRTNYDSYEYQSLSFLTNAGTTGCAVSNLDPVNVMVDCSDKPLVRSPKWSGVVSYEHVFDLPNNADLKFEVSSRLSAGYYTSFDFVRGPGYQSAFSNTALNITYDPPGREWSITAYVKNIENEATSVGAFQNGFVAGEFYNSLAPPRTYGVRAFYKF